MPTDTCLGSIEARRQPHHERLPIDLASIGWIKSLCKGVDVFGRHSCSYLLELKASRPVAKRNNFRVCQVSAYIRDIWSHAVVIAFVAALFREHGGAQEANTTNLHVTSKLAVKVVMVFHRNTANMSEKGGISSVPRSLGYIDICSVYLQHRVQVARYP